MHDRADPLEVAELCIESAPDVPAAERAAKKRLSNVFPRRSNLARDLAMARRRVFHDLIDPGAASSCDIRAEGPPGPANTDVSLHGVLPHAASAKPQPIQINRLQKSHRQQ
jgi:hypothetical protein